MSPEEIEAQVILATNAAIHHLQELVLTLPAGELRYRAGLALCKHLLTEGTIACVSGEWPREQVHAYVDQVIDAAQAELAQRKPAN
jgi:hypothetical protein